MREERLKDLETYTYEEEGLTPQEMTTLIENAREIGKGAAKVACSITEKGVELLISAADAGKKALDTPAARLAGDAAALLTSISPAGRVYKIGAASLPLALEYYGQVMQDADQAKFQEYLKKNIAELVNAKQDKSCSQEELKKKMDDFVKSHETTLLKMVEGQIDTSRTLKHIKQTLDNTQEERNYQADLAHARSLVNVTTQLLGNGSFKAAKTFNTVASSCIQLYDAKRTISRELSKLSTSKLTPRSALRISAGFAGIVSAGLSLFGLFDHNDNDKTMQIILEQLNLIRQDIRDFRQEVAKSFEKLSTQIGSFQQEMNRRLDELSFIMQNNGTRLEKCIQEVYQVSYVSNRDELQRLINEVNSTRGKNKAVMLPRLSSWAKANCTIPSLTGSDLDMSPKDITSSLKNTGIESKLGYLQKIANSILPNPVIMPKTAIANPIIWRTAAFTYMDTLVSMPKEAREEYINDEGFYEEFRQIALAGTNLQEFIKQIQTNQELFNMLFKNYKDSVIEFSNELFKNNNLQDPEVQKHLVNIGKWYELIRAFSELGFNYSYNNDMVFSHLMKKSHQNDPLIMKDATDKIHLLRLLSADDLSMLFTANSNADFRKMITIQLKQMSDLYKSVVDFKINSVKTGNAIEPCSMVEDTIDALGEFGSEYSPEKFKEEEFQVQNPCVQIIPTDYLAKSTYGELQRTDIYAINHNTGKNSFDDSIQSEGSNNMTLVKGPYRLEYEIEPEQIDAALERHGGFSTYYLANNGRHIICSSTPIRDGFNFLQSFVVIPSFLHRGYNSNNGYISPFDKIYTVKKPKIEKLKVYKNNSLVSNTPINFECLIPGITKPLSFMPSFSRFNKNELLVCSNTCNSRYCFHYSNGSVWAIQHPHYYYQFYISPDRYKIQIINLDTGKVTFNYDLPDGQILKRAYFDNEGDIRYEYQDAKTGELKYGMITLDRDIKVDLPSIGAIEPPVRKIRNIKPKRAVGQVPVAQKAPVPEAKASETPAPLTPEQLGVLATTLSPAQLTALFRALAPAGFTLPTPGQKGPDISHTM